MVDLALPEKSALEVLTAFPDARISAEYPSSTPISVQANELLESVFENLIANGVRHNDQEVPEVEVGVEQRDDEVRWRSPTTNREGLDFL